MSKSDKQSEVKKEKEDPLTSKYKEFCGSGGSTRQNLDDLLKEIVKKLGVDA